jgi:signal transduction histidine kinase
LEQDRPSTSTAATGRETRDELISRHDDAVARCAAMAKHEEDTAKALRTVVHDLKNPISSIIGSCEYLAEYSQENLEPEQREMIGGIAASARTLLQLSGRLYQLCGVSGRPAKDDATIPADEIPTPNAGSDTDA